MKLAMVEHEGFVVVVVAAVRGSALRIVGDAAAIFPAALAAVVGRGRLFVAERGGFLRLTPAVAI